MSQLADFPKYLMKINGKCTFLPFSEAYVVYNSGSVTVEFGRYVLNMDFTVRDLTDEDKKKISKASDDYSASK